MLLVYLLLDSQMGIKLQLTDDRLHNCTLRPRYNYCSAVLFMRSAEQKMISGPF